MKNRKILGFLGAAAMTVLLAGCAESANDNSGAKDTAKDNADNKVTIAYAEGSGQTMDPHNAADLTSASYAFAMYDQLVTSGTEEKDGKTVGRTDIVEPSLAESWDISEDGLTYTFKLRKDAKFTSGNDVNADAVLYSFERIQKAGEGGSLYELSHIKSVEKVDDYTVKFTLSEVNPVLLKYFATFTFSIVDPAIKDKADDYLTTHSAGSGAFELKSWDPATGATFEANDEYWNGEPEADEIDIKYVAEASNRELMLKNKDVDVALDIPAKDVAELEKNKDLVVSSESSNRIYYMGLNANYEPFDNAKVREAINYVVDQQKIIDDILYGQGNPLKSSISSKSPAFTDEYFKASYDLDKAKKLLAEAGYKDGFKFEVTVSTATQDYEDTAVLLQSELKKIGVDMKINLVAPAQYSELITAKKAPAFLGRYTSLVNDPAYHYGFLLDTKGASNYAAYSNKKVDALLKKGASTTDEKARQEIYNEVQQIVTADSPWIYLYESNLIAGLSKDVEGYVFYPDEIVRFDTLHK